ncbi:hypothetical protein [Hwanghaeella sp.]|uniref:hypothetical protein n=1 Tax=Hwanghaeella sp. TaxID=2605943 RepID=UPI003CCB9FB5
MDAVFNAMGLDAASAWPVIGVALGGGLLLGIGATTAIAEIASRARHSGQPLRFPLALLATIGLVCILAVLGSIVLSGAAAPAIVLAGLGFLGGPPLAQAIERMEGSRSAGLGALVAAECAIISVADIYLL